MKTKNPFWLLISILLFFSCSKKDNPTPAPTAPTEAKKIVTALVKANTAQH
ncbi:MAG: hypothetical protein ACK5NK_05890 [Niabella sp.]